MQVIFCVKYYNLVVGFVDFLEVEFLLCLLSII
jgi:hypothetical protein